MTTATQTPPVLRDDATKGHVGPIELLFDLVYVFTIIQLSHYVVEHLSLLGLLQATVLFLAVWWGWNYTAWAMNWLNPHARPVQLLLAVLMLAALTMAVAIPEGLGERAWMFVAGYVALQLIRGGVMTWVFRGQVMGRNYAHLSVWSLAASAVMALGLLATDELRLGIWALAVLIDYAGPRFNYWVPGRGSTPWTRGPSPNPTLRSGAGWCSSSRSVNPC